MIDSKPLRPEDGSAPTRPGLTRKFRLRYTHKNGDPGVMGFYFTANTFEDGRLGEVFLKADKPGSLASGTLDAIAIMISIALQHGVPLALIIGKLRHMRFTPDGFTGDQEFPSCSSVLDLLAQWLEKRFLPKADDEPAAPKAPAETPTEG